MTRSTRNIFIVLTGGYGNIGDAVIRRRALDWVRDLGTIHAYVGNGPAHWREQMGLTPDDTMYRAKAAGAWVRRLFFAPGRPVLVFEPGEVLLSNRQIPKEAVFLLLTVVTRLRGGIVIRNPRAVRDAAPVATTLHRLASRLSQVTLWREQETLDTMQVGTGVPDIAFSEDERLGLPWADRRTFVISLRGPRPYPRAAWFDAMRAFTAAHGLKILTVSQVREDENRNVELSAQLGGTHVPWGERTDVEQEAVLRDVFAEAAYVVSDRLHVAILGILSGAIPVEVVPSPSGKMERHFRQIGVSPVSLDSSVSTADEIVDFLGGLEARRGEFASLLADARARLAVQKLAIRSLVTGPPAPAASPAPAPAGAGSRESGTFVA